MRGLPFLFASSWKVIVPLPVATDYMRARSKPGTSWTSPGIFAKPANIPDRPSCKRDKSRRTNGDPHARCNQRRPPADFSNLTVEKSQEGLQVLLRQQLKVQGLVDLSKSSFRGIG